MIKARLRSLALALGRGVQLLVLASLPVLPGSAHGLSATAHLFVPAIYPFANADLTIEFTNPTVDAAAVTLIVRAYSGEPIVGAGITNPAIIRIPPLGQTTVRSSEVFGEGIADSTGWIEATPSTSALTGVFFIHNSALEYIDGASLTSRLSSELIFAKVNADTTIAYVNTGPQPVARAGLILYENDGSIAAARSFPIPARSGYSGSLSSLVAVPQGFTGYAVLNAASTPFGSKPEVLAGVEIYRKRSDIAVLGGLPATSPTRTGYLPHVVTGGGFYSALGLVNLSRQSQKVRITVDGITAGGAGPTGAQVVERIIPGFGRLEERVDQLFNLPGDMTITGFLRYETQTPSTEGVCAYIEYGTTDDRLLAAATAQTEGFTDIFFSHVSEGEDFYTGLALLNPNFESALVTIDSFDGAGDRIASAGLQLQPGARRAKLLPEVLPGIHGQSTGYVHLTASQPIFALQLFGQRRGQNVLSNVSVDGLQLQRKASGLSVVVALGAIVTSPDGAASVAIPPAALVSDRIIRVETVALNNLPEIAGKKVIVAVEMGPAGSVFRQPVKITLRLPVSLSPGTAIPLLLFNSETRQYLPTNFMGTVDETGRIAAADITLLSTYVIAIPR